MKRCWLMLSLLLLAIPAWAAPTLTVTPTQLNLAPGQQATVKIVVGLAAPTTITNTITGSGTAPDGSAVTATASLPLLVADAVSGYKVTWVLAGLSFVSGSVTNGAGAVSSITPPTDSKTVVAWVGDLSGLQAATVSVVVKAN